MDPTEDLSARVLLKHILTTEPVRTPITRSASKAQGNAVKHQPQSSSKSRVKAATPRTPQDILRRSMRDNIHKSISRTSLPASKKKAAFGHDGRGNSPESASVTFTYEGTPRDILKNILHTEPAKSPVVHEKTPEPEPNAPQSVRRTSSRRSSTELSGLDLGDVTAGNFMSPAKGLSRKRQRRSLNVTAFEKRLRTSEVVEEPEQPAEDLSSLSLSSTSLSLKTPFAQIHTEKRGLQRRASNRKKITEQEFDEAVKQRQLGGHGTDTTVSGKSSFHGLCLRDQSDMQVTHDIINCNTALYSHDDHAIPSNLSIVATQDKPTVMASQLSRDLGEEQGYMEEVNVRSQSEEEIEVRSQSEEEVEVRSQSEEDVNGKSQSEEDVDGRSQSEEEVDGRSQSEEEVDARSQSEEEVDARSQSEVDVDARSQSEVDVDARSQSEVDVDARSQSEVDVDARSQSEEDVDGKSQSEEDVDGRSQFEEEVDTRSQSEEEVIQPGEEEEEEEEEEEGVANSDGVQPDEDGATAYSQTEDEEGAASEGPGEQEEWGEESGPEDIPMETPAFVRQKRRVAFPNPAPVAVNAQAEPSSEKRHSNPPKPKVRQKKPAAPKKRTSLPKSYLMATFKHFAKTRVSGDVYPVLSEIMEQFFDRLMEDVETYAAHAKRKTIEVEDVVLLLKRQGHVNDKVPVEVLIEKYLRMQQRKLLIPIATSGNVVVPKSRRW
ncbi:centromere protein T [Synchiropus splendidus]|uniref:centromere protein T n=1 Tax=Synchiropus splendidus TaxID=270530 RepID=UPI00237E600A|nr:centromere protein T [Synchiropus splendidus]